MPPSVLVAELKKQKSEIGGCKEFSFWIPFFELWFVEFLARCNLTALIKHLSLPFRLCDLIMSILFFLFFFVVCMFFLFFFILWMLMRWSNEWALSCFQLFFPKRKAGETGTLKSLSIILCKYVQISASGRNWS